MTVPSVLYFVFPGDPLPCPRPRLGNRHAHHSPAYAAQLGIWRACAMQRMAETNADPFPPGTRLTVRVRFYRATRRRCDLDNLLKSALDALTGTAWADDSQVDVLDAAVTRGVGVAAACTVVEVFEAVTGAVAPAPGSGERAKKARRTTKYTNRERANNHVN